MNQILNPENSNSPKNISFPTSKHLPNSKKSFSKIYKIQFIISLLIASCFLIIFFTHMFKIRKNEKVAEELMGIYHISTLYAENTDYSATPINTNSNHSHTPFVIGMIKIDKIGLNYPILSQSNKELLDISLCRFAGPLPNEPR